MGKSRLVLLAALFALILAGCSNDPPITYSDSVLSGTIDGVAWTSTSGAINADGAVTMQGDPT